MKTILVLTLCLVFVAGPVLAEMEEFGQHGQFGKQAWNVIKHGAEQVGEHKEKVAAVAAGTNVGLHPAGHKPVAAVAASGHASSTVAVVLTSLAIASVFIGLLVYDLTHPSGARAFEGSSWDSCANAQRFSNLEMTCQKYGWLHR